MSLVLAPYGRPFSGYYCNCNCPTGFMFLLLQDYRITELALEGNPLRSQHRAHGVE